MHAIANPISVQINLAFLKKGNKGKEIKYKKNIYRIFPNISRLVYKPNIRFSFENLSKIENSYISRVEKKRNLAKYVKN